MDEMLGNQFFITRRFKKATPHFERVLQFDPHNDEVKKKIIICYIQQGKHKLALQHFTELISSNIDVILNNDPVNEDCPCQKLIYDFEHSTQRLNHIDKFEILGMLWLYCDIMESRKFFQKLLEIDPRSTYYKTITNIINDPY